MVALAQKVEKVQKPPGVIVVGRIRVLPMVVVGAVLVVVEEAVDGGETAGIVGATVVPTLPTVGNTLIVGTAGAELTPRLPISVDPIGIPVRAPPPCIVDVGIDDEAVLVEPEPHIPDSPDVSSIPEVVDIPDVADIPDDIDVPDVAAVAGAADPAAIPPPSKLAVDPNIPDGEVPVVEHIVPPPGIATVPVMPVGAGLIPGDASSVAPIGIPVPPTDAPGLLPSGEVTPSEGVGATAPTWANAGLEHNKAQATAAIKKRFMECSRDEQWKSIGGLRSETIGRRHELGTDWIPDQIDCAVQRCMDCADGIAFVAAAPHRAADRPCSECNARSPNRGAGNFDEFHVGLTGLVAVHCRTPV
jgi:hypothetical protein